MSRFQEVVVVVNRDKIATELRKSRVIDATEHDDEEEDHEEEFCRGVDAKERKEEEWRRNVGGEARSRQPPPAGLEVYDSIHGF